MPLAVGAYEIAPTPLRKVAIMKYIFSATLATFLKLGVARMRSGAGCVFLLQGLPGGGKTAFAKALAAILAGQLFYYAGSPDKERDLLYEIDVDGVLRRERGWVPGPAWEACARSKRGEYAVLLIDEIDKTNTGFDAFLLRFLEEWAFRAPDGTTVEGDPRFLAVVVTSNGRRQIRPEVLRRTQRIEVPLPTGERLREIVRQIAGCEIPTGLLDLVARIGDKVREQDVNNAPAPKELALCCVDLLSLAEAGESDSAIWREIAASWLVKTGGAAAIDKAVPFKWAAALISEARKGL